MAFDDSQSDGVGLGNFMPPIRGTGSGNDQDHFPGVPGRTGDGGYRGTGPQGVRDAINSFMQGFTRDHPRNRNWNRPQDRG